MNTRIANLQLSKFYILILPFLFSFGIAALFYPGFMSYDTLHALHGARDGITESMWPPMVSYVWRVVDLVSHNPSAMHFSQVFLLIFSIFFLVLMFTNKMTHAVIFLVLYLSIPSILGTIAVIWKDVLMAAFFISSIAMIVSIKKRHNISAIVFLTILTVLFLFIGVCSRHNAIMGATPLIFFLASILCSRIWKNALYFWLGTFILGSILTGIIFFTKLQLDCYSLPHLIKINTSTNEFIQSVRVLDIAGASLCTKHNFFDSMTKDISLADITRLYEPKHINLSAKLLSKAGYNSAYRDNRIDKIWLNIAAHHPLCFFYNKLQLTKYLLGANKGEPFLITAPAIDKNSYGYKLPKSSCRDLAVTYIMQASQLFFFKPWFLYCFSVVAIIYLMHCNVFPLEYFILFLSAILYFMSLVIFGNAADARLPFYTTTTLFILTFLSISEFIKKSWFNR